MKKLYKLDCIIVKTPNHQFIFRFYSLGNMIVLHVLSFFILLCYTDAQCTNTIKVGSRGECVKVVQRTVGIDPDGIFGANTKSAVMNFQKRHGLVADGIVGRQTWTKIYDGSNTGGRGNVGGYTTKGKMSTFGGPNDHGVSANEGKLDFQSSTMYTENHISVVWGVYVQCMYNVRQHTLMQIHRIH